MKKWIVLALSLTALLGLTACGNGNTEAEKLAVYSLSGKNEDFRIINGMIVVTDEKQVLSGGDLELLGDGVFEDIVFYPPHSALWQMGNGKPFFPTACRIRQVVR